MNVVQLTNRGAPSDPITTAQDFAVHVGRSRAERQSPTELDDRWTQFLFSHGRFRKARIMDALAVALLIVTLTIVTYAALLLASGTAKADSDPSPAVVAYTATYGGIVCGVIDHYPSTGGVLGVVRAITDEGFTPYEVGEIVGLSVADICPRHLGLVQRFVRLYGPVAA